jgi:hypothetical protein
MLAALAALYLSVSCFGCFLIVDSVIADSVVCWLLAVGFAVCGCWLSRD